MAYSKSGRLVFIMHKKQHLTLLLSAMMINLLHWNFYASKLKKQPPNLTFRWQILLFHVK